MMGLVPVMKGSREQPSLPHCVLAQWDKTMHDKLDPHLGSNILILNSQASEL